MRPLSLELEGFTAYRDYNRVDFDGLQLVVLTGPNGSGKSSLLEAMIFSLFGVAPRMKGKQSRDFIAHGRDQFRIGFQFHVDGNTYRVQRRYLRKGQPQVRLEMKQDGGWKTLTDKVEETNRAISGLLNMGYDTFTKAIILPQNLFDQFLKGDKEKRREVLEEILNLELFEKVAVLAGEKSRILRERIRLGEQVLAEKGRFASPENLRSVEEAAAGFEREIALLVEEKRGIEERLKEWSRISELVKEVEGLRERERFLLREKEGWDAKESELSRLKALLPILPKLARYSEKSKQFDDWHRQLDGARSAVMNLATTLDEARSALDTAESRVSTELPSLKIRLEQLHALQETVARFEKQRVMEKALSEKCAALEKEIRGMEARLARLSEKINQEGEALGSAVAARKEKEKLEERFQLYSERLEDLSRLRDLDQKIEELEKKRSEMEERKERIARDRAKAASEKEKLDHEIARIEEENKILEEAWMICRLQEKLTPGGTCPVCEQRVEKPPHQSPPDASPHKLEGLRGERERMLKVEAGLSEAEIRCARDLEEVGVKLCGFRAEQAGTRSRLAAALGLPAENLLEQARDEYRFLGENQKSLKELRRAEEDLRKQYEQSERERAKTSADLDLLLQQNSHSQAALLASRDEMSTCEKKLAESGIASGSLSEVREATASIDEAINRLTKQKEEAARTFDQTRVRQEEAAARLETLMLRVNETEEQVSSMKADLENMLPALGFSGISALPAIEAEEIFRIEKELNDFRFELKRVEERIAGARAEIGDRTVPAGEPDASARRVGEIEERVANLRTETGKMRQQIFDMEKAREESKAILAELEQLKKSDALYATIQQDFQKNRLPDFLLSTVLSTILDTAADKLHELSQKRYRLILQGTGEIHVQDSWSDSDETRSVASLSGGESFAASLAVALALSEYLQGRQRVQSLFIDEGFGSLDRETRDKVAEVLTSLRTQDKLIGIVTHIEELAELFPDRIIIEKLPEGSRVSQMIAGSEV